MSDVTVTFPESVSFDTFRPIAYYDKHMDCIRVVTHDRSVTEHRINDFFTIHECNHSGAFDPQYVGFTIKGVRHLFNEYGLPLDRVYRLAELIDRLVRAWPGHINPGQPPADGRQQNQHHARRRREKPMKQH